jgi:hypothetical protein
MYTHSLLYFRIPTRLNRVYNKQIPKVLYSKDRFLARDSGKLFPLKLKKDISEESSVSFDRFDMGDQMSQEGTGINPDEEPEAKEEQEKAAEDES